MWHDATDVFKNTILDNGSFWVFKELLKQAYVLQDAAEVYKYGGHIVGKEICNLITNNEMYVKINKDLEIVLNTMWDMLTDLKNKSIAIVKVRELTHE